MGNNKGYRSSNGPTTSTVGVTGEPYYDLLLAIVAQARADAEGRCLSSEPVKDRRYYWQQTGAELLEWLEEAKGQRVIIPDYTSRALRPGRRL